MNAPLHPFTVWTQEQDAALTELHTKGCSFALMAAGVNDQFHTHYSRNACIGRARRLGISVENPRGVGRNPLFRKPRVVTNKPRPYKPRQFTQRPKQMSADEIQLRCAEVAPLNLTLAELDQAAQCHYIAANDHRYCGHPRTTASSYCWAHMQLCERRA